MDLEVLIDITIPVLTLVIGYFAGVYLPYKFRKEDKNPQVSAGPLNDRQLFFEITNHGGDLLNMEINIEWLQDGEIQQRRMTHFYNLSDNPVTDSSHNTSTLRSGETKRVARCPKYSDNGKVKVVVEGEDTKSDAYNKELIVKNEERDS